jgi:glutaminyl-peptide cyclotransferase
MDFGPRTVGSKAHDQALAWMQSELEKAGWDIEIQNAERMGHPIQNLVARRGNIPVQIILGAHYDSRLVADQDGGPGSSAPVPGANDGASGVAILLELARTLPHDTVPVELLFIDAEDNGNLPGWDWLLGSRAFVDALTVRPRAVIIVDMIGDADLNIYKERNSDPALVEAIWAQAAALGYEKYFIPSYKYSMIDDHTPFLEAGIPAVDIIDFDYPYWHTSADTADKVSAQSLEIVGKTVWAWIVAQK